MVLVVMTVLAALAIGVASGGRFRDLAQVSFRGGVLVGFGLGVQLVLGWLSGRTDGEGIVGLPLLIVSQVALLAFFWLNRRLPGIPVAFAGFAMNALVIILNGAMPVSRVALRAVPGGGPGAVTPGKHRVLEPGDALPFLADVIPLPPLRTVVSVGDVALAVGVAILIVTLMRRPHDAEPRRDDVPAA
ncbi:MAG: hypothetical protein GEU81_13550 [Nitriliruptorales bacterium]|nr:hypothetical protein [Nitriliruptorales bacterium]